MQKNADNGNTATPHAPANPSTSSNSRRHKQPPLQPIDPSKPKPALLAQSAVGRIPRWLLWSLSIVYALAGFVGRVPWQGHDIESLGVMQFMATNGFGLQEAATGYAGNAMQPFTAAPYWLGALAIHVLEPLQLFSHNYMAVQSLFATLLLLTFVCVWYACYYLARTPDAQPVPFALGGEAKPVDYARSLADAGVLAFMACLGLMQIGHEHSPSLWQLLCCSMWLLGMAAQHKHSTRSLLAIATAYVGLCLGGAPIVALLLCCTGILLTILWRKRWGYALWHILFTGIACAIMLYFFKPDPLLSIRLLPLPQHDSIRIGKLLIWFTWPAGLLGLLAVWKWRNWWRSAHIALPALMALAITTYALYAHGSGFGAQRSLILALPAVACLASFALPTTARDFTALIDWFTLIFFCVCGLAIWVVWISLQTGFPEQPARNVARLVSGYQSVFLWKPFVLALLASAAWIWLVYWRVGRHRSAIWKSLALPAGGTALCWLLLTTLWLPMLNHARGNQTQTQTVLSKINSQEFHNQEQSCAYYHGIEPSQIIALHQQNTRKNSGTQWLPIEQKTGDACGWLVLSPKAAESIHQLIGEQLWELHATIPRKQSKKREPENDLWLYKRAAWWDSRGVKP